MNYWMSIIGTGCGVRNRYHIYCPGCGGTRAVEALLKFDIWKSLYCNPVPLCLLIDLMLMVLTIIFEKRKQEPFKYIKVRRWSKILVLVIMFGFSLIRNYLLIFKGIDILGDFSK